MVVDDATMATGDRLSITHDYLTQRGGAERVVTAWSTAFPDAPVHTALYDPDGTYPEFKYVRVETLALDRVPMLRRRHRLSLPLMALAFSRLHVDGALLCSSSGWAHGASCTGPKVVYCHSPARWLYRPDGYLRHFGFAARSALSAARSRLVRWDQAAMASATRIVVNSTTIAEEVSRVYGRDSVVVPPASPLGVDGAAEVVPDVKPGSWLTVCRLLGYKRLDVLCEVARTRPDEQFVVVGEGPHEMELRAGAPPNVFWLGQVEDAQLRWLYGNCGGLISTSAEDFGLTPVEAAAFGRPSIVPAARGYLDHVVEGHTGIFHDGTAGGLSDALDEAVAFGWSASAIQSHAAQYHPREFGKKMVAILKEVW